ncbi:RHS domain-containing protein [uncultured Veillonella sp.]|uniref:RHS domain-containing protein n=1 Tax=uncultured Veillonella sp. TaxID=159268 RepID=UPI00344EA16E
MRYRRTLAQVHNWTNEDGESRQQNHYSHYSHCDQIDIPCEIADKDGNLVWFGDYYGWGKLKSETNVTGVQEYL